MPGLIDCHVHLASQSSWSIQERLLTPYSLLIAHALNNARITLEAGFTSVRDAAGTPRGVKMAIDQGLFPGPRMRIAVAALSQTGGHGDYRDEETIDAMKQRGTYFVPTLIAPLWVLRRAEKDPASVPPYAVRKAKEVLSDHQQSFRLAVERGVRIAMGTDTGVGPHGTNAEELELMVEGGMTPMQAIVATTRWAAECARIAHVTGTLEVGKRADILGVDGDPLSDIRVLQNKDKLALIMRDGQAFKSPLSPVPA